MTDIFELRDKARRGSLSGRVEEGTPTEYYDALVGHSRIEREKEAGTLQCSECDNIITITDVGMVCRQCRLEWPRTGVIK